MEDVRDATDPWFATVARYVRVAAASNPAIQAAYVSRDARRVLITAPTWTAGLSEAGAALVAAVSREFGTSARLEGGFTAGVDAAPADSEEVFRREVRPPPMPIPPKPTKLTPVKVESKRAPILRPQPASSGLRSGDDVFHRYYAPGGTGSGHGSTPQYTAEFRAYLENLMRARGVRRVLDYGCGDWSWANLVDWRGIDYHGVDIVPSLIGRLRRDHGRDGVRFDCIDPSTWSPTETYDLVICKDVLQHLPNDEIASTMQKIERVADAVLWINDFAPSGANAEAPRGGYRKLDPRQPPFNRDCAMAFEFKQSSDRKVAFLWTRADGAPRAPTAPTPPAPIERIGIRTGPLPALTKLPCHLAPIEVDRATLAAGGAVGAMLHNPSVVVFEDKLWVSVRARILRGEKNKIVLGQWGQRGLENVRVLVDHVTKTPNSAAATHGFQDARLFEYRGALHAMAVTCDLGPTARPQMAVLDIDQAQGAIVAARVCPSPYPEKNWAPLIVNGRLYAVYTTEPVEVIAWAPWIDICGEAPEDIEATCYLRGGSQLIKYEGGYLAVVHEVFQKAPDAPRVYAHRFVQYDHQIAVRKVSDPFYFENPGVEFCAGLAKYDGKFVLGVGIEDKKACLAYVDEATVKRLLDQGRAGERRRVLVCHSPHERCGIREYGTALDECLSQNPALKLETTTHPELGRAVGSLATGDVLFVHYEPGLVKGSFKDSLAAAKRRGATVIFCCHYFDVKSTMPYQPFVDRFVVHREYEMPAALAARSTVLPLACPVYEPGDHRRAVRRRMGWADDDIVLITVGFLTKWKRVPDVLHPLMRAIEREGLQPRMRVHLQLPPPFLGEDAAERRRLAEVMGWRGQLTRVALGTEFLQRRDLVELVAAADLGFVYHGRDTGSVSAATKQFVSARCPVVVTSSTHASDLSRGVERVDSLDPTAFAERVVAVARDASRLAQLRKDIEDEYKAINMQVVADSYARIFRGLV